MQSQPQIQISHTYVEDRNGQVFFLMRCRMIVGEISAGATLKLPFSAGINMTIPVDIIESSMELEEIIVGVRCEDLSEADFLEGMNLTDEIMLVV